MSQPFYKIQATGNDFIFFLKEELKKSLTPEQIKILCERRTGVGADGLVLIQSEKSSPASFRWDFYNSDGSEAEMCGNAARCAMLLISEKFQTPEINMNTKVGVVQGQRAADGDIIVTFSTPVTLTREIGSPFGGRFSKGYLTNTGVPHFVIPTPKPWELLPRARELAPFIFDKEFGAAGANLTFVNWDNKDELEVVTLERGVNDFTLSCGTGVIAAANIFADLHKQSGWFTVKTPGGVLKVHYEPGKNLVSLKGPAQMVYKGEL